MSSLTTNSNMNINKTVKTSFQATSYRHQAQNQMSKTPNSSHLSRKSASTVGANTTYIQQPVTINGKLQATTHSRYIKPSQTAHHYRAQMTSYSGQKSANSYTKPVIHITGQTPKSIVVRNSETSSSQYNSKNPKSKQKESLLDRRVVGGAPRGGLKLIFDRNPEAELPEAQPHPLEPE